MKESAQFLIHPAQEMLSSSGFTAAEGSMFDSRAAPKSCSGSSSYVFACRSNATVRKHAAAREDTKIGWWNLKEAKIVLRGFVYLDKKRHVNYQGGNNTKHQAQDPIGYRR